MQFFDSALLYLLHSFIFQTVISVNSTTWRLWNETNVRYNTSVILKDSIPLMMCLIRCQKTLACIAVQVNEGTLKCDLLSYYLPGGTLAVTGQIGWTFYEKDFKEVSATAAWLSSTHGDCFAEKAIDGKLDQNSIYGVSYSGCLIASTHDTDTNPTWAMEFQFPVPVASVLIHFGNYSGHVWMNTQFSISIHTSFAEAKNSLIAGWPCTNYTGVGIALPIRLACGDPTYGRALRIRQLATGRYLQICEIKVFYV